MSASLKFRFLFKETVEAVEGRSETIVDVVAVDVGLYPAKPGHPFLTLRGRMNQLGSFVQTMNREQPTLKVAPAEAGMHLALKAAKTEMEFPSE